MSVDKEMWRQPNESETGHACQNGWVKELKKPAVHPNYDSDMAFAGGVCLLFALIALILVIGLYVPSL